MRKSLYCLYVALVSAVAASAQTKNDSTFQIADTLSWIDAQASLDEVAVVAHVPMVRMRTDKMTYQVKNDVDAKTQTVLQMLRKVPMVTVDGKNNITVNGSREFKVYVDGRLNTMITRNPSQVFRNMPASSVQSIEVVTNPGARYDVEGVGGVLNITTKKKKNLTEKVRELSGSVNATASTNNWGMDASISGQRNRFSFDLNMMGDYTYYKGGEEESSLTQKGTSPVTMKSWGRSPFHMPFMMGELSMGYQLDSLSSLHLGLSATCFGMSSNGTPNYLYSGGMYGDGLSFSNHLDNRMKNTSYDGNLAYQHFFGLDNKGSMTLTYQFSHNPTRTDNSDDFFGFSSENTAGVSSRVSKVREKNMSNHLLADFVIPFTEKMRLNTGAKLTMERNTSNSADERADNSGDAVHYRQRQGIVALYGEYEATFGWLNVKPGVRYEHTWQKTRHLLGNQHDYQLDYGLLVPALSATASLGESQNIGLNYNLRIRRPGIEELDPYRDRSNPSAVSYGNPQLDAEKTHNLALVYSLSGSRFSMNATLRHSLSSNAIQQYSFYRDGLLNTTFGNVVKNNKTALNLYLNWSMTGSTRMLLNAEAGYADLRSKALDAHNSGWAFSANYGIQQNLPWNLKLSANLELMTREYTLQGWDSGMAMCSASIAKSFCRDKWSVTLSGTTGIGHGGNLLWKQYSEGKDFISSSCMREPIKNISVGISYKFGGKKYDDEKNDVSLPQRKKRR
ncbi:MULTISPECIES: TonB-dependent receptor domain-containing protein [unclassified Bacteroides]|uniref:TonB-dependent receptor domain-containing protein n=1 Tax=unclassified Bacteroides TaxID=2646097 RepID=UPI0009E04ABE|nr:MULTISPECIES: TonB-dependent receptor [unclassified Bacteroides]